MAKDDDSQQNSSAQARVYKAKDVHRRRADRKSLKEKSAHPSSLQSDDEGQAAVDEGETSQAGLVKSGENPTVEVEYEPGQASAAEEGEILDADAAVAPGAVEDADLVSDEEEGDDAGQAAAPEVQRRPKASPAKRIIGGIVLVVILCAVGVGAYFAWDRWGRYDDHADMQGEWYVAGTTAPLSIDAKAIHLTDDLSYEYEIDDHGKTVHFTFGPMEGQGRYWFSGDRRFFAITDGEGYNGARTALEDIMHAIKDFSSGEVITGTHLPEGEGVIVFCREPGKLVTMAKEASERGKERAKKQAEREKEEAERKAAAQEAAEAEAAARAAEVEAAADPADYYYYDDGAVDNAYDEDPTYDTDDVAYEEPVEEVYVEPSEGTDAENYE